MRPAPLRSAVLISVVIPVFQECRDSLQRFAGWLDENYDERVEFIVVCTSDERQDLIGLFKSARLIVADKGRARQMNAGASWARGRFVLFLHSDTFLEQGWIDSLDRCADARWGAFTPAIEGEGLVVRSAALWGLWRSRYLGLPYGDQAIFVCRQLFETAGAYDTRIGFMEDLDLSRRLDALSGPPEILPTRAWTSDRAWREHGRIRYSLRNLLLLSLFLLGVDRSTLERIASNNRSGNL